MTGDAFTAPDADRRRAVLTVVAPPLALVWLLTALLPVFGDRTSTSIIDGAYAGGSSSTLAGIGWVAGWAFALCAGAAAGSGGYAYRRVIRRLLPAAGILAVLAVLGFGGLAGAAVVSGGSLAVLAIAAVLPLFAVTQLLGALPRVLAGASIGRALADAWRGSAGQRWREFLRGVWILVAVPVVTALLLQLRFMSLGDSTAAGFARSAVGAVITVAVLVACVTLQAVALPSVPGAEKGALPLAPVAEEGEPRPGRRPTRLGAAFALVIAAPLALTAVAVADPGGLPVITSGTERPRQGVDAIGLGFLPLPDGSQVAVDPGDRKPELVKCDIQATECTRTEVALTGIDTAMRIDMTRTPTGLLIAAVTHEAGDSVLLRLWRCDDPACGTVHVLTPIPLPADPPREKPHSAFPGMFGDQAGQAAEPEPVSWYDAKFALGVDTAGRPVMATNRSRRPEIEFYHCADPDCRAVDSTTRSLDVPGQPGGDPARIEALAMDRQGRPVAAVRAYAPRQPSGFTVRLGGQPQDGLYVVHCGDWCDGYGVRLWQTIEPGKERWWRFTRTAAGDVRLATNDPETALITCSRFCA
ncbi:hypothetical protein [Hamadaea tsunoensis]|uniref:hypothetical protein n=1 Tax=Hamadaea tsunoensis TaxID=53368 RepID=UPI000413AD7D|nr:hypothetical protein [Hamadaea tsunoensis]